MRCLGCPCTWTAAQQEVGSPGLSAGPLPVPQAPGFGDSGQGCQEPPFGVGVE